MQNKIREMQDAERTAREEAYRKQNEYRDNLQTANNDYANTVNRLNSEHSDEL